MKSEIKGYVYEENAVNPNEDGNAQDDPAYCGHCGEENSWREAQKIGKRKCEHCNKLNEVWSYRLWVVRPITKETT
jgi:hypothetical protein